MHRLFKMPVLQMLRLALHELHKTVGYIRPGLLFVASVLIQLYTLLRLTVAAQYCHGIATGKALESCRALLQFSVVGFAPLCYRLLFIVERYRSFCVGRKSGGLFDVSIPVFCPDTVTIAPAGWP